MWPRCRVAPALSPHPPPRPLTDRSTPTRLRLNRLLICSARVGQGRRPRRGDGPERIAGRAPWWVMSCKRGGRLAHVLIRHLLTPNLCVLGNEKRSHCVIQRDVDRRTLI